jgi:hypothetical protein
MSARTVALACVAAVLAVVPSGHATGAAGEQATPARLGAYYFGGWSGPLSHSHFNGLPSGGYTGRQPLYGWRDTGAQTLRAQLYWAGRMGIDFFNFLWYHRPDRTGAPFLNDALETYVASKEHHGVGFAITYTNEDAFVVPRGGWRAIAEQWVTRYFTHPDYVRIGGRPVLFVLEGNSFFEQHGGDFANQAAGDANVNAALEELRQAARARGLPGVYVVAGRFTPHDFDWDYFPEPFRGQTWDAVTQFAYPALAGVTTGQHPFSTLSNAARAMWERMLTRTDRPYVPAVTVGWDARPWLERADFDLYKFWFTRSPGEVAQLVSDAIAWTGRNPHMRVDSGPPLVLLSAWNELGEGAYLVPTRQDGFAYGQALASVLGLGWSPQPRTVSVKVAGRGSVRVNGTPCAGSCARRLDEGLVATLTARPARGYRFRGWSGGCSGREPACTILMDRSRSVRARFAR